MPSRFSVPLAAIAAACKAKLSRKIAFSVFTSFMVIEAIVLVPSLIQQTKQIEEQQRQVTTAKLDWIVQTFPHSSPEDFLRYVQALQQKPMLQSILGGRLYRASTGQVLGQFGAPPELTLAVVRDYQARGKALNGYWFKPQRRYDAIWFPEVLKGDYVLVIRHEAVAMQNQLYGYILRLVGIILLIAAVITLVTMLVVQTVAIAPILQLRDRLMAASDALRQPGSNPQDYLMAVQRQDELGEVITAFNESFLRNHDEMTRRQVAEAEAQAERQKAEKLLLNILPLPIAEDLKRGNRNIAEGFADVTVLFADIVGFTELSSYTPPDQLVALLNQIFSEFDALSDRHGLEKIKTIGDNYMVAGGLPLHRADHAQAIADMALDMQLVVQDFQRNGLPNLNLRIGINTGPVVAGVIGTKKFIYDLWGDAVNIASRMESHGLPGRIQVTESTYVRLQADYVLEERGCLTVKGKGEMVTYWLQGRKTKPGLLQVHQGGSEVGGDAAVFAGNQQGGAATGG